MLMSSMLRTAHKEGKLRLEVTEAAQLKEVRGEKDMFTPTEVLAAIGAGMTCVRKGIPNPVVYGAIDQAGAGSAEEAIFAGLANDSLRRNAAAVDSFAQRARHNNPGACSGAEVNFAWLLRAAATGNDYLHVGPVLVFEDESSEPLLVQKFVDADTALNVRPVAVDGIEYPEGTLFSVFSQAGHRLHEAFIKKTKQDNGELSIRRLPAHAIDSIAPVRLSMYGLPPEERPALGISTERFAEQPAILGEIIDLTQTATMADFRQTL